jgi:hypothetical protein
MLLVMTPTRQNYPMAEEFAHAITEAEAIARALAAPIVPDTSRHPATCMCCHCEARMTGEWAMREAEGDYTRFLVIVAQRGRFRR